MKKIFIFILLNTLYLNSYSQFLKFEYEYVFPSLINDEVVISLGTKIITNDSNFLIYNPQKKNIAKFSQNKELEKILVRGKGPCEFQEVSAFEFEGNVLHYFDRFNFKFVRYNLSNKLCSESVVDGSYMHIYSMASAENRYLVQFFMPNNHNGFVGYLDENYKLIKSLNFKESVYSKLSDDQFEILKNVSFLKGRIVKVDKEIFYVPYANMRKLGVFDTHREHFDWIDFEVEESIGMKVHYDAARDKLFEKGMQNWMAVTLPNRKKVAFRSYLHIVDVIYSDDNYIGFWAKKHVDDQKQVNKLIVFDRIKRKIINDTSLNASEMKKMFPEFNNIETFLGNSYNVQRLSNNNIALINDEDDVFIYKVKIE